MVAENKYNLTKIAIFARNHKEYLENAINRDFTTFRAKVVWRSAFNNLQKHNHLKIYFAPIEDDQIVKYKADIHQIKLNPTEGDEETEKLLSLSLEETIAEGLWDGKVKTLYTISNCKKLTHPFQITDLVKISDAMPISNGFKYSYSIVYERIA